MDDELHDLVPQRRDVKTALLRLHDDPVPILSRRVLTNARLSRFLNFLEIAPQAHVVHLGIEVVEHGLPRELAAASQGGLVARLNRCPAHGVLIAGGWRDRRHEGLLGVLCVVEHNGEFRHSWHPFLLERLGTHDAGCYPHCRPPSASQYERAGEAQSLFLRRFSTWRRITSPLKYNKDTHLKPWPQMT